MSYKISAIACALMLASLARAGTCPHAAAQPGRSSFGTWYGVDAAKSSQPYVEERGVGFLECVNRCQAERKPDNEDKIDVETPGENPPADRGCRSISWEEDGESCFRFSTIPQNLMVLEHPDKDKRIAMIDGCRSDRLKDVKTFDDTPECCDVWYSD